MKPMLEQIEKRMGRMTTEQLVGGGSRERCPARLVASNGPPSPERREAARFGEGRRREAPAGWGTLILSRTLKGGASRRQSTRASSRRRDRPTNARGQLARCCA